jgi:hypothetical protein
MSDMIMKRDSEAKITGELDLERYEELLDEDLEEVAGGDSAGFHKTLVINSHTSNGHNQP